MKRILTLVSLLCILCLSASAQEKIFPIKNGRLDTDLDANGLKIINLDTSNLLLGAGIYQPLDQSLTDISSLTTAPFGLGLLQLPDSLTAKAYLSVIEPTDKPAITNKFITAYDATTGTFTQAQPDASNLSGTLSIAHGGTGATTATAALNALLPAQAGHAGQTILTNGSTVTWSGSPVIGSGVTNAIATLTSKPISNAADPTNGQVLTYNSSTGQWEPSNVSSASTGTVSAVAASDAAPLFTSVVTDPSGSASIAYTLTDAPAHSVFGNNSGSTGAPDYFTLSIAALSDAGTLPQWSLLNAPISNVVGIVDSQVLANKTITSVDNTIQTVKYIRFDHPNRVDGSGAVMLKNDTADYNNQGKFSNFTAANSNWVEYRTTLPDDFNTSGTPRVRLKLRNWASNIGAQRYIISMANVISSAPSNQVMQNPITVDVPADLSGNDADIESVGWVTLTGWNAALIPGSYFIIRVARDGNNAADTSTADTVTMVLEFEYQSIQ